MIFSENAPYLVCSGLFKIYKVADLEVVALCGLELTVDRGEVIAVVGASGSGKSTMLNIFAGYDTPSAGTVRVGRFDLLQMTNKEVVEYRRQEVGFVWQETSRNLFPYLNVYENVELPMLLTGVPSNVRRERSNELLELVGLGHRYSHRPSQLSGGEQQRVAIAVALANRPPLLLADEPTGELDEETAAEVLVLLNDVNKEIGTTIVIVTHDPAISSSVGRAITIRDGKTSTETTRAVSFERSIGGEANEIEEYLLVDSSGSIQIPREILNELSIKRRVRIGVSDGRVTLESGE
jgi:ABC-type lipoprotein export system ATPase subunit